MDALQQIHKLLGNRWIFCLCLLLAAYLVPISLAQDASETTTQVPLEPTLLPTLSPITPVLPTLTVLPATQVPLEPTLLPTLSPITPISPTPTTPILTFTPTPTALSLSPRIAITTSVMRWPENAVFPLIITAEGLSNVPQMTVTCQNDPAILRGIRATPGDLLLGEHIALSDSEFQTNGQWQLTGIQINPAPSLPNTGVLWYLDYQVIAVGVTSLVCWIQLVEHTGQSLPVTITSDEMIIEGYRDETAVPPTVEIMHLSGSVVSSLPLEQATVTISRTAMQESTAMASDGTFAFDVPPGDYQLTVTASHHLPVVVEVVISEQLLALPTIMLTGGDVDGNEVIDIGDVNLIVQYYGFTVPPASSSLDLNGDAVIDLLDLTIVSANLSSTLHINE